MFIIPVDADWFAFSRCELKGDDLSASEPARRLNFSHFMREIRREFPVSVVSGFGRFGFRSLQRSNLSTIFGVLYKKLSRCLGNTDVNASLRLVLIKY